MDVSTFRPLVSVQKLLRSNNFDLAIRFQADEVLVPGNDNPGFSSSSTAYKLVVRRIISNDYVPRPCSDNLKMGQYFLVKDEVDLFWRQLGTNTGVRPTQFTYSFSFLLNRI